MDPLAELLGESPPIIALRDKVRRLLAHQSDSRRLPPFLILGETGTGKGLLAAALHRAGPRASGPFVDVNCAAIPENLLEAEMFGFERGAFTDARQSKPGLFQTAHRGTLFLDEVGLLPEALQGKLLKAIEDRAVRRLGGTRSEPADAWVVAATSVDLAAAARERRFREDLYHRLAVLTLTMPPLRERGADILLLASHFLGAVCADYGLPARHLTPDARDALLAHAWPGNVRELANTIERAILLSEELGITADGLGLAAPPAPERAKEPAPAAVVTPATAPLSEAVDRVEREHLLAALERTRWNITRAAADLGVSRDTLRYRIEKHGLQAPAGSPTRRPRLHRDLSPSTPDGKAAPEPPLAHGVRWEERRVALLQVTLSAEVEEGGQSRTARELEMAVDKIKGFGGRVHELSPSGVVAGFGLEPVEDAPRRAAHAALAIRRGAERAREVGAHPRALRMAIHVDRFMVGDAGGNFEIEMDAKRRAWTVLETMVADAGPDAILISETAVASLERRFELSPLGPAYLLVGYERSGLEVGRRMAAFVGRDHDLQMLQGGLRSALEGRGRVVGIAGEAGIGKSRLLFEFLARVGDAVACLRGHCLSYATSTPYHALTGLVRQGFGVGDADPSSLVGEKIAAGLANLGLDVGATAPYLLRMLGTEDGTAALQGQSPETVKARTFEALRQVASGSARRRPLIVLIEDLQWIDRTSEEWLASLADALPRLPILLLVSYRSGYRPPWIERSYASQVALQPLGRQDSLTIIQSVATAPIQEALADSIVDRAEGNPFFLEELSRSLAEQAGTAAVVVPETIQEVLRARIDRLAEAPRQLLQTAAVLGRTGPMALLSALADDAPVQPRLQELAGFELLYEEGVGPAAVFVFRHALVQEVAYESLAPARRRALHAAAARALESLHGAALDDVVDRLAYHYARAAVADKAIAYFCLLAEKATRAFGHVEAIAAVRDALAQVELLPKEEQDRQILALALRQVDPLTYLGRFQEIVGLLLGHRDRLDRVDDPALSGPYFFWLARTYSILGDPGRTVDNARLALEAATRCHDQATMGKAYFALSYECFWSGRPAEGVDRAREAVRHLEGSEETRWVGEACWMLGINHAALGDFDLAIAAHARAGEIGRALDDPRLPGLSLLGIGAVHALARDWDQALEACQQGLDVSTDPVQRALALGFLGGTYLERGDAARAIPLLEQSVSRYASFRVRQMQGWFTALLGEAYLQQGDTERAATLAAEGLEIVTAIDYRWGIGYARRILGHIALARNRLADAESQLGETLRTFTAMGTRYEVARTHLDLARLAHRRDDLETARSHIDAAVKLFSMLGASRCVDWARRLAKEMATGRNND